LVNLLASAIAVVADDHDGKCDLTNPATPAATATLVREQGNRLEYLVLCDGLLVVDDGDEVSLITDLRFERAVAGIRRDHLTREEAIDSPEHAARVLDAVLRKQQLTNTPAGYWIAAANPEAASHAVTGALPLTGHKAIRRAALLTDGASRAVDLFGMFDWRHMLDLLEANDPQTLIHLVREAERADHDGRDKPRFKRHDDATVAMVTFSTKGN